MSNKQTHFVAFHLLDGIEPEAAATQLSKLMGDSIWANMFCHALEHGLVLANVLKVETGRADDYSLARGLEMLSKPELAARLARLSLNDAKVQRAADYIAKEFSQMVAETRQAIVVQGQAYFQALRATGAYAAALIDGTPVDDDLLMVDEAGVVTARPFDNPILGAFVHGFVQLKLEWMLANSDAHE